MDQIEKELQVLETSIKRLQALSLRYKESAECVEKEIANEVLVPITDSIYVPGTLVDNDKFLIEIGTGYYIERRKKPTIDYFNDKVAFVNAQIDKYTKMTQEKAQMRENVQP